MSATSRHSSSSDSVANTVPSGATIDEDPNDVSSETVPETSARTT